MEMEMKMVKMVKNGDREMMAVDGIIIVIGYYWEYLLLSTKNSFTRYL